MHTIQKRSNGTPQLSDVVSSSVDMPNLCLIMSKRSDIMSKCDVELYKLCDVVSNGSVVMSKCGVDLSKYCHHVKR